MVSHVVCHVTSLECTPVLPLRITVTDKIALFVAFRPIVNTNLSPLFIIFFISVLIHKGEKVQFKKLYIFRK